MAKSQRHKRIASKKAKKAHQQAKAKQAGAPKQWTREASWRDSKEPKATFQHIIDTFELLESVLTYLPPQELLHTQAACFKIKSTVEQSQTLRQKLFLEPDNSYRPLWKLIHSKVESYDQPIEILQGDQQDNIDPETGFEIRSEDTPQLHQVLHTTRIPMIINPLILEILPHFGRMRKPSLANRMLRATKGWDIHPERLLLRLDVRTLHPESKILKMFLTQPPTKHLAIRCSYSWCDVPRTIHIHQENGITVSDLAEACEEYETLHDAGTDEVWYPHADDFCESFFRIEIEILDGLAITETEREIVHYGDQKKTSFEHANPYHYRRVYPYSCQIAPFEMFPTPIRRVDLSPYNQLFDWLSD